MTVPGTLMIFLSAIVMAVSLNHLFLARKLKNQPVHLAIFLAGFAGSVFIFLVYLGYQSSPDPGSLVCIYKYQLAFLQASMLALLWAFSILYNLYSRQWLITITATFGAVLALTFLLPKEILFSSKPSVSLVVILGSPVNLLDAGVKGWRVLADITLLAALIFMIRLITVKMAEKTTAIHIKLLTASGLFFLMGVTDHLVDYGRLNMVYLVPLGFFILFALLSTHSLDKMVKDLRSNAEIALEERKWRRMLQEVRLIVVELDITGHIKYANPYLLELTGYKEQEVIGRDWFEMVVPSGFSFDVQSTFLELLANGFYPCYQNPIITKYHEEKMISWFNVKARDRFDNISGSISIGIDISEIRDEKLQLEQALKDARALIARLQGPIK